MSLYKVNKNGKDAWYIVKAPTAQEAIEQQYDTPVYHYNNAGQVQLFTSLDELRLFAAILYERASRH